MKKGIVTISILFLLSGTLVSKDISKIKIVYGAEGTHLMVSAKCTPESFDFSFGDDINFLTTYDDAFIHQFKKLQEKLLPINDSIKGIDPRILTVVFYKDSTANDTIYFGEHYGISCNDTLFQDNDSLLSLVKRKIGWTEFYLKRKK